MLPIDGWPVLTPAEMRTAEDATGDLADLMERAGRGVADAVRRLSGGAEVLVLCGPGNNGGDGYVAARVLRDQGYPVRVAALAPPRTPLAVAAAARWGGTVEPLDRRCTPAPVLVDALFGTGGRRDPNAPWVALATALAGAARLTIAIDLPSGVDAGDASAGPGHVMPAEVTLALGALKPAHVRADAVTSCGRLRVIDLGLDLSAARSRVIGRPDPPRPDAASHKYSRGMVAVLAGAMPGAALLAATAAARAGAGYVALIGDAPGGPHALVHRPATSEALADDRVAAFVVGPGLGRDDAAVRRLGEVWGRADTALVVDGDALHLIDRALLDRPRRAPTLLTPHAGEYRALRDRFDLPDDPAAAVGALACPSPIVLIRKGPTTVVADAMRTVYASGGDPWLSTAGTGDVLAGAVAAMVAAYARHGRDALDAAAAGVWLHARAARLCGPAFVADDLAAALTAARGEL